MNLIIELGQHPKLSLTRVLPVAEPKVSSDSEGEEAYPCATIRSHPTKGIP